MKSNCIKCAVLAIIGAPVGLILAYFFSGEVNITSLASAAVLGSMVGLLSGVSAVVRMGELPPGRLVSLGSIGELD